MAEQSAAPRTDDVVIDLDLRDEESLLVTHRVEYEVEAVRSVLAAINLQPAGGPQPRNGVVMDLAVFRATGCHALARIFGSAR